jgi:hypothetical protein
MQGPHNDFKKDVELALATVAAKYGFELKGVGIAPKDRSVVVITRFAGEKDG